MDGVIAWARNEAATGRVLNDWAGWCEKFINNAGAFNQAFSSATAAGNAAGYKNPNPYAAPRGAIHYYYGAGGFGHDAFDMNGGGTALLMASSSVDDNWGHNIGVISWDRYQARVGLPYRGWSLYHGTEVLAGGSTAGGGTNPIEDDMTPEQDAKLNSVFNAIFYGGASMQDNQRSISASLAGIVQVVDLLRLWEETPVYRQVDGVDVEIPQIQDNADTNTFARRILEIVETGVPVDIAASEDAIAQKVADKVIAALPEGVTLTKDDIVEAVKSVSYQATDAA